MQSTLYLVEWHLREVNLKLIMIFLRNKRDECSPDREGGRKREAFLRDAGEWRRWRTLRQTDRPTSPSCSSTRLSSTWSQTTKKDSKSWSILRWHSYIGIERECEQRKWQCVTRKGRRGWITHKTISRTSGRGNSWWNIFKRESSFVTNWERWDKECYYWQLTWLACNDVPDWSWIRCLTCLTPCDKESPSATASGWYSCYDPEVPEKNSQFVRLCMKDVKKIWQIKLNCYYLCMNNLQN